MNIKEYLPVIIQVLKNPYVIGTAIVVFLLMDFCVFVANYRKKPPKKKVKKAAPPPPPKAEGEGTAEGEANPPA